MPKSLTDTKAALIRKQEKLAEEEAATHREKLKIDAALRQHAKQEQAEEATQLGVLAYAAGLRLTRVDAAVLSEAFLWLATCLPSERPWEGIRGRLGETDEASASPGNGQYLELVPGRAGKEG